MEFSYRISEAEYLRAVKIPKKTLRQIYSTINRWMILIFFTFTALMLIIWTIVFLVSPPHPQPASTEGQPLGKAATVLFNLFFLAIFSAVAFLLVGEGSSRARKRYRKDSFLQGQFTVDITPGSISVQNTAGSSSQQAWTLFAYWREKEDLIVLVRPSREFLILNLAGLSGPQRAELRGLLASVLPQK